MTLYHAAEYEIPVGKVIYNYLTTPSLICFKEFIPREEPFILETVLLLYIATLGFHGNEHFQYHVITVVLK